MVTDLIEVQKVQHICHQPFMYMCFIYQDVLSVINRDIYFFLNNIRKKKILLFDNMAPSQLICMCFYTIKWTLNPAFMCN